MHTHAGVHVPARDFTLPNTASGGASISNGKLYILRGSTIRVFRLTSTVSYDYLLPIQFDTVDFNNVYVLMTNTIRGDITTDTSFNINRVSKYVKSTNSWVTLLDSTKGQPQIAEPYDFGDQIERFVDNRKMFRVVRENNKTLIFIGVSNRMSHTSHISMKQTMLLPMFAQNRGAVLQNKDSPTLWTSC